MNRCKGKPHQSLCRDEANAFAVDTGDQNSLAVDLSGELLSDFCRRGVWTEIWACGECHDAKEMMFEQVRKSGCTIAAAAAAAVIAEASTQDRRSQLYLYLPPTNLQSVWR